MQTFTFTDETGTNIFVYEWEPEKLPVRGVVQISHGMAETAARYERFAHTLTAAGFAVVANDHRGHGQTAPTLDDLGYIGEDGYNWMIRNLYQINRLIRTHHPELPVFLFGHSMGSFLVQQYIALYGHSIQGSILSGTSGSQGALLQLGTFLAKREMNRKGPRAKSPMLANLTFRGYNKAFQPTRTPFDWLSRDAKEVDLYIDNPYCGGIFTTNFFYHFYQGLAQTHQRRLLQQIPKHLPIHIVAGDRDPVGRNGKGVKQLLKMYRKLQLQQVTYKFYPGGRHELLNETNRDEVTQDILDWLEQRLASCSRHVEHK